MQYDSAVAQYESSAAQERAAGAALRSAEGQIRVADTLLKNLQAQVEQNDANLLPGMTANIKVVTEQRESVLQVPNAALRFRPPGVEADTARNPSEAPRSPAATGEGRPAGEKRAQSEGRQGGNRAAADGAAPRRGAGQPGRVWVIGDDGKPRSVPVQLGISDGRRSEVVAGPLTEQSQVIVSTGGPGTQNNRAGSEPRLRF